MSNIFNEIDSEEKKRSKQLVIAIHSFQNARVSADYRIGQVRSRIHALKEKGDPRDFDGLISPLLRQLPSHQFALLQYAPRQSDLVLILVNLFYERKSPLYLWRFGASGAFAACLRDMATYLISQWKLIGLGPENYVHTNKLNDDYKLLDQQERSSLNNMLAEIIQEAGKIGAQNDGPSVSILLNWRINFRVWGSVIQSVAASYLSTEEPKSTKLVQSWRTAIQKLQDCFIGTVLSDKTDGRIARALAASLNSESAKIISIATRIEQTLETELDKPIPPKDVPETDIKMEQAVVAPPLNPSFGMSLFGRPVVPIRALRPMPTPMDVSRSGGHIKRFFYYYPKCR